MTMVTSAAASACNTNFSKTLSLESNSNHRDASFSSYLHGGKGISALELSEANQNMSSLLSHSYEHIYIDKKKAEEREIGIFSAEKYFKGAMDDNGNQKTTENSTKRYQNEKEIPVHIDPEKPKTQSGSPSVRSASSWTSQSMLLPTNQPRGKTKKVHHKSFLSSIGCSCSCKDKNSVKINDHDGEKTSVAQPKKASDLVQTSNFLSEEKTHCKKFGEMGVGLNKEDIFSFPVLNSKQGVLGHDDLSQKSLEVFGSPVMEKEKKISSLERKISMLTWDALIPRLEEIEIPRSPHAVYNDDTESDASSDLFEIESFSAKSNSCLARQTSDGTSSCVTPRTCYAPSETSIAWSVVTASAADVSIMSDMEDLRTTSTTKYPNTMAKKTRNAPEKELNKRRPSMLSGCKSHKAVRVAGEMYKINEKTVTEPQGRHRLDPCKPIAKFQAETKLTGYGSRHGHKGFNIRSASPAHASHPLYIE